MQGAVGRARTVDAAEQLEELPVPRTAGAWAEGLAGHRMQHGAQRRRAAALGRFGACYNVQDGWELCRYADRALTPRAGSSTGVLAGNEAELNNSAAYWDSVSLKNCLRPVRSHRVGLRRSKAITNGLKQAWPTSHAECRRITHGFVLAFSANGSNAGTQIFHIILDEKHL